MHPANERAGARVSHALRAAFARLVGRRVRQREAAPQGGGTLTLKQQNMRHSVPTGAAEEAGPDIATIATGEMSDCVSAVVLWGRQPDGRYEFARGYHGGGGYRAINFDSLLAGVPDDEGTLMHICLGFLASDNANEVERVRDLEGLALGATVVQTHVGASNYRISRTGEIDY